MNTLVNVLEKASSSIFPSSRARLNHSFVFPLLDACSVPAPGTEAHRQKRDTVHPEVLPAEGSPPLGQFDESGDIERASLQGRREPGL